MIRHSLLLCTVLSAVSLTTSVGVAQVRLPVRLPVQPPIRQLGTPNKPTGDSQPMIPPSYRPPPGMCRIWLDGVPPQQQPASTDCASAVRNRPGNGRVIFGDDYVQRGDKKDKQEKKPSSDDRTGAIVGHPGTRLFAVAGPRVHGPQSDDAPAIDAIAPIDVELDQPPAPRRRTTPAPRPQTRADSVTARRTDPRIARRDSMLDAQDRRREAWDARHRGTAGRDDRDDRDDDDRYDDRTDRTDRRYDDRSNGRSGDRTNGQTNGRYDDRYTDSRYPQSYDSRYPQSYDSRYAPPGRANGTCLDRDGDGWCDDSRTGGGYCRDLDGDGRCDDYPGLASAPYASALPPMRAAADVQRGVGSEMALRWLGTAEVRVRTSDLKRTGAPYRAMWLDANTGSLLQVWTDRNGDGIADRIEIYRNGRVVKTIGQ